MRIIILVQTLIIALAAYYIYILSQEKQETVSPEVPVMQIPLSENNIPKNLEGYTPPTSNPPDYNATPTVDTAGHNDAGMEYPTFDSELEVR